VIPAGEHYIETYATLVRPLTISFELKQNSGSIECGVMSLFPVGEERHSGYFVGVGFWWQHEIGFGVDHNVTAYGFVDNVYDWNKVQIVLSETQVFVYINGVLRKFINDTTYKSGKLRFGYNCKEYTYRNVVLNERDGYGGNDDWNYCESGECLEGQGDCDTDNDCADGLICGTDNCRDFDPDAELRADCCISVELSWNNYWCSGSCNIESGEAVVPAGNNYIETYATVVRPMTVSFELKQNSRSVDCGVMSLFPVTETRHSGYSVGVGWWQQPKIGFGVDHNVSEYGLVDNVYDWNKVQIVLTETHIFVYINGGLRNVMDDTTYWSGKLRFGYNCREYTYRNVVLSQREGYGGSNDWSYCNSGDCLEGQGDCDYDYHCADGLICGTDNCRDFHPDAETIADCCYSP